MVTRSSQRRQRDLRTFGEHLRRWRKANGLTAVETAERAAVTRETLRNIEEGTGTARLDSVFAVLGALGVTDAVLRGVDPYANPAARARIDGILGAGEHR